MTKEISLLREWYFRTREANFRSCYPSIAVRWEKAGLAWQEIGVGFELSRSSKPRDIQQWEEAGHQFAKLPELQQALIVGSLFHGWTVSQLAYASGIARYICKGFIRVGLQTFKDLCVDAGLVEEEEDMSSYLSGRKNIARYFGVSEKTIRRWEIESGLPVARPNGSILAHKDDLDSWFLGEIRTKCPHLTKLVR